ncbi:MAG: DUF5611 family protein [Methanolinea sp.]|nr:DUF5611 family protein [Methanolinea sp.]
MQEYPVKRGYGRDLPESIPKILKECFGVDPKKDDNYYQISYGALVLLKTSPGKGGKTLIVHTESDRNAPDDVILDTNRRFRTFLEKVTGYSTKERVKLAKSIEKE